MVAVGAASLAISKNINQIEKDFAHTKSNVSPRIAISNVLNFNIDGKVQLKILKILSGVIKMATNMNLSHKAKDLLLSEPLSTVITKLKSVDVHYYKRISINITSINRIACHIAEFCEKI